VSFTAHPSLSLLRLESPADAIWRAVLDQDSEAMARIDLKAGPVLLSVERDASGVQVRRLTQWVWEFTAALSCGQPLHVALGIGPAPPAEQIHAVLAEHLACGRFVDFSGTGDALP
jgi:hypothetical protein